MIICDTSGLYAAYNSRQPEHRRVVSVVEERTEPLVVSPYVLAELDYLMRTRMSIPAEVGMLRDVEAGAYEVAELEADEFGLAATLVERYQERNLGLADAANVVLAARFRTTRLLTLDTLYRRWVRPLWGDAFTVLPADRDPGGA